jgi:hypothetical protein
MIEAIFSAVFTVAGLSLICFNKPYAYHVAGFWNKLRPNMYGQSAIPWLRLFAVVGGSAFIAYGIRDLW